ncbi:MAG: ATP-binding cassette domain-containing protein [Selenomonas ruminantium]|uniref:ATP-binding cassette domain-containing protein n=1 Tax=Selenomonas ruminantium TaxID=971 RepID=A0A1I0X6B0_SELRU|nr:MULTISPECIES: ATP-binding cassette domain-containing protein [Selenomonas]MBE6084265.1 ATP-binding cassette domain-containing protein [Selenomonas ruminantium]SDZ97304.1 ATPase components of ABC transporters with duplicated ATPase domains [Selenomonas ruminantium]SFA96525.1 ATPase components of ABC transporters with duplicated ATPase domains [Selenomonas ruminantium]
MITTNNVSLQFGKRVLYKDVNLKFTPGNCYGIIGANGAGKSTFLKLLSGEIEPTGGNIEITPGERLAVLQQDHYAFDDYEVLRTVIMGHKRLVEIMEEKDALYAKPDFSEEDGMKASELEAEFAELNGWDAESEAARLLNGLGIPEEEHTMKMADLTAKEKVRVLLAQALFGNPDILLLDEPTNHLDVESINWLEDFLAGFENTVIVVSHDRHFLNQVCTYICDVDFGAIQLYAGNYDFWYQSSQLALQLQKEQNKKAEEKIKELQNFIARFAANAAKSKQATSRKKLLDKIKVEDIKPSSRRYPYIAFTPDREAGDQLLQVDGISKTVDGEQVLKNVSFTLKRGDKVAFVGPNSIGKTMLFKILMGEEEPDEGTFKWGVTTTQAYLPADNSAYFDGVSLSLVDWLRQYSKDPDETFVRGFLGRMLFSGEESLKKASVLSGGERVRCMLSKMMLSGANVLLMDEPTNHLDLESITALNNGLIAFGGTALFVSHDHEFVQTIANRIIDITPDGVVDRVTTYDDFLANETVKQQLAEKYGKK